MLLPVLLIGLAMIGFRMQIELMRELAPGQGDGGQAGRQRGAAPAGPGHARPDRPVAVDDHAQGRAGRQAAGPARAGRRANATPCSATSPTSAGSAGRRCTTSGRRSAATGRPTLAIEAITARTALDAAGIKLDDDPALTLRSGTFDPDAEAALAWCLREAVTNVIRHSGARSCRMRLTERHGEDCALRDHRRRPAGLPPAGQEVPKGSGLRGMSERLSAVGGTPRRSQAPATARGSANGRRVHADRRRPGGSLSP